MNFDFNEVDAVLTCTLGKKIDANRANEIAKEVREKLDFLIGVEEKSEELTVVFDLNTTDYVSSLFLKVVVMAASRVSKNNIRVLGANQFIRDLFKTSGLDQFIQVAKEGVESVNLYYPTPEFSGHARIGSIDRYRAMYDRSINNPDEFWREMAHSNLIWEKDFTKICEWKEPYAKWFLNGKLNVCYNCLDRHYFTIPDKTAIIWEGEHDSPAEVRKITYAELYHEVCKLANVLRQRGVVKGDRVIIYMPMIPETAMAMLACARIGAIHSVVFAGFSAQAIAERTEDCGAKIIITADGGYRRGSIVNLKKTVDNALKIKTEDGKLQAETVEKVIVYKHVSNEINFNEDRDLWWHEEVEKATADCKHELLDSEDVLFILYTSGSTGKPKGITHTCAGYLLGAKLTHKYVFDTKDNDIYWCTADVGWITGHSYVVYGPLANGSTIFMYEGVPNFPDPGRFWKLIEKHEINVLYTAPTTIRSFMKWGDQWPAKYDLSSLRLLGSVGEPINPQAWLWFYEIIGYQNCPIVDTWWQTETGSIMITPLPGGIPTKAGSATLPFFGVQPKIVDDDGNELPPGENGILVITKPWPSMMRGLWGDHKRYVKTYWTNKPGYYVTGDGARKDDDDYIWIIGREDDVINVSGHRIGTAEVENVLVNHSGVVEAAVVGRPDDLKGTVLVAFVTLMQGVQHSNELAEELRQHVGKYLGPVVKPEEVRFAEALPKTRSGKIMRRFLKQVAAGLEISGDITTIEDFNTLLDLIKIEE